MRQPPRARTRAEVAGRFKAAKLPLTHQRLAVYERLAASHDHPSAEALYTALKPDYPSLSLATVYKTLQTLLDLGLAAEVDSPAGSARYDALTATHHHAVCTACGRIEDVFDEELDRLPAAGPKGFKVEGHSVHFRGLCASCAETSISRRNP